MLIQNKCFQFLTRTRSSVRTSLPKHWAALKLDIHEYVPESETDKLRIVKCLMFSLIRDSKNSWGLDQTVWSQVGLHK